MPGAAGALAAFAVVVLTWTVAARAQEEPGYVVIVNEDNPATRLSRDALSRMFLKQVTWWPDGVPVRPVDLDYDSGTRRRFSETVIQRSTRAVRSHWQQAIFSGRSVPPPVLATDEEVVAYVNRHRGAIGYVSPRTPLDGAHIVEIR